MYYRTKPIDDCLWELEALLICKKGSLVSYLSVLLFFDTKIKASIGDWERSIKTSMQGENKWDSRQIRLIVEMKYVDHQAQG